MYNLKTNKTLWTGQAAQNTAGVVDQTVLGNIQQLAFYVRFGPGTSAGVVTLEGAHDPTYAGTWASLATITWAAAERVHYAAVTGVHRAIRLRISTAVVGGTCDAYVIGN